MDLKRRTFVAFLSAALAMRRTSTFAQPATRLRTVGVLMGIANDAETKARAKIIEQGLAKEGWIVGQNLRLEYRYAASDAESILRLAKELVSLHPDVIIGHSTPVVAALHRLPKQFRSFSSLSPTRSEVVSLQALRGPAAISRDLQSCSRRLRVNTCRY